MGITKTEGFDPRVAEMADVLKALGHPARLSIMEFLAKSSTCICNDIVDELPLAQPTISRHLSELKRVGLIKGVIEGKNTCYCINEDSWSNVLLLVDSISNRAALRTSDQQRVRRQRSVHRAISAAVANRQGETVTLACPRLNAH